MKKVRMKATGKEVFLTGRTKKKAGRTYHQVLIPWTKEDDKKYEKYWGKKRPKEDKGQYEWQTERMFEMKTYNKYLKEENIDEAMKDKAKKVREFVKLTFGVEDEKELKKLTKEFMKLAMMAGK